MDGVLSAGDVADQDLGACGRQGLGDRETKSTRTAGYNCDFSPKTHVSHTVLIILIGLVATAPSKQPLPAT